VWRGANAEAVAKRVARQADLSIMVEMEVGLMLTTRVIVRLCVCSFECVLDFESSLKIRFADKTMRSSILIPSQQGLLYTCVVTYNKRVIHLNGHITTITHVKQHNNPRTTATTSTTAAAQTLQHSTIVLQIDDR